jgi:hypothetical protein
MFSSKVFELVKDVFAPVYTQFKVNDFHFWRADRNQYGGGLVAYARSDLACDRKINLEYQTIESICIEITINNRKWFITNFF